MRTLPVYHVVLPPPKMGGKIFCATNKAGYFVLERGPCVWRALSCTHSGSGVMSVYDGVPDERGFFPDEELDPQGNGRLLFIANPAILGMWMYDADCQYGLTVKLNSEHSINPTISIVWKPQAVQQRQIVDIPGAAAAPPTPPPATPSTAPSKPANKRGDKNEPAGSNK